MCIANRHVRFSPNSDHESGLPRKVMSALLPKADMCSARGHVCFGPIADIALLFDHLVGAADHRLWDIQPERLCRLQIDGHLDFRDLLDGQVGGLVALENEAVV